MSLLRCTPVPDSDFAVAICLCGKLSLVWFELRIAPSQAAILGYDRCIHPRIDRGRAVLMIHDEAYPLENGCLSLPMAVCSDCKTMGKPEAI